MKTHTNELIRKMKRSNGFFHLIFSLLFLAGIVYLTIFLGRQGMIGLAVTVPIVGFIVWLFHLFGLCMIQPNQSVVLVFFGKYSGTVKQNGFFWLNPFYSRRKLSLRARNMNAEPIKVNDKSGNPIMIGMVLVWKIHDTYKACFEIDTEAKSWTVDLEKVSIPAQTNLSAFDRFVSVQSDAALRKVAGMYAYDHVESNEAVTLRSGGEEVTARLEQELRERLAIAGVEVVEARINNLAYAPEIASVMLRRQQAEAIIAAREKIVDGAVSLVELALKRLEKEGVVELDSEKKATMASNLMVVLCADESAKPVINAGSLY